MARAVTLLVVAAVVGLAAAAGVDALRGAAGEASRRTTTADGGSRATTTQPVETDAESWVEQTTRAAARELRASGAGGVLTYADENCRLRGLTVPDLLPHPTQGRSCEIARAAMLRLGPPVGDPQRILVARCASGWTELGELGGPTLGRGRGCEPAWRPDGVLTAVRRGEVVSLFPPDALLSSGDLTRALRRAGWAGQRFSVREIAWLSGSRLAAIVRAEDPEVGDLLVVFDGRRLVREPPFAYDGLHDLQASPRGRFVSAEIETGGLAVVDRLGRPVVETEFLSGHALTWSPDEHWAAVAAEDGIDFFQPGQPSRWPVWLPIVTRDLVWR
jgi:hypothetical protein